MGGRRRVTSPLAVWSTHRSALPTCYTDARTCTQLRLPPLDSRRSFQHTERPPLCRTPGFSASGTRPQSGHMNDFWGTGARFNDHKYQQLDSLEILLFSGTEMLRCSVSSLYSHTHTDLSRCRGKNHSKRARI